MDRQEHLVSVETQELLATLVFKAWKDKGVTLACRVGLACLAGV